jgi:hypothetical protein
METISLNTYYVHTGWQAIGGPRNHGKHENDILNESIDRVFTDYTLCLNAYVRICRQALRFRVTMETVKVLIGFYVHDFVR